MKKSRANPALCLTLWDSIERILEVRKMPLAELERKIEVSPRSLYSIRKGNLPGTDTIFRMAKVLKVPMEWLLGDESAYPATVSRENATAPITVEAVATAAAAKGRHVGGRTPFGYRVKTGGGLEPDPATREVVPEMFRLY